MKASFRTLLLLWLVVSLSLPAMGKDDSPMRRRLTMACTALLATTTVGLAAYNTHTGQLKMPGFGARVMWSSDRRAIVILLARALGIKQEGNDMRRLEASTYVTEARTHSAKGYIVIGNEMNYFELAQQDDGHLRFSLTTSPQ